MKRRMQGSYRCYGLLSEVAVSFDVRTPPVQLRACLQTAWLAKPRWLLSTQYTRTVHNTHRVVLNYPVL